MSNTSRLRLLLVPLMAWLALAGVGVAAAAPPTLASGTFTYTSTTFHSTRVAGGDKIMDLSATVSYTGTFTGTSTLQGTLIIHADGSTNTRGSATFTGMVNGKAGTVTLDGTGTGAVAPPPGSFHNTDVIVGGTGDLATLHGVLSEVGMVHLPQGPFGTYTGQISLAASGPTPVPAQLPVQMPNTGAGGTAPLVGGGLLLALLVLGLGGLRLARPR